MTVSIEILPLSDDDKYILFSDLKLFHVGCMSETMQQHRNPATNLYSFRCGCGFYIELTDSSTAANVIIRTATDNQTRDVLPTGSFSSNITDEIVIEPRVNCNP
jgi:hypothetical protein